MTSTDHLFNAADTVKQKSTAALAALLNAQALAAVHAAESPEPAPPPNANSALVLETERAIEMSTAALEEIAALHQKEKN